MTGVEPGDTILGLDVATKTGWAVLAGGNWRTGSIQFRGEPPNKLRSYRRWLRGKVREDRPALIGIEMPPLNNTKGMHVLAGFYGVSIEALADCNSPVIWFTPATIKKEIGGRGSITTAEKNAGALVRALNSFGFGVKDVDEADALAIACTIRKKAFGFI